MKYEWIIAGQEFFWQCDWAGWYAVQRNAEPGKSKQCSTKECGGKVTKDPRMAADDRTRVRDAK